MKRVGPRGGRTAASRLALRRTPLCRGLHMGTEQAQTEAALPGRTGATIMGLRSSLVGLRGVVPGEGCLPEGWGLSWL